MIDTSKLAPDDMVRHFPVEAYDEPDSEPAHGSAILALVVGMLLVFAFVVAAHLLARFV